MRRSEYEQRRRALEEIHEADLELIRSAHEARLRSLEALWLSDPEEDPVESPAPALPVAPPRIVRPVRALGWAPDRAALFRALEALVFQRRITVERFGSGRVTTTYRKK